MPGKTQPAIQTGDRIIDFAGREWTVKSGCGLGPGPNCWSDDLQSVWVEEGQLHLKIREIGGTWHAAEVSTVECTRYGMHRFFTVGGLDTLDRNVVAALFLYKDDQTEVDIEFSKWGEANLPYNAQYVVQPWNLPGHRERFLMSLAGTFSTHSIDWNASGIQFRSIHGHYQEPPDPAYLIHEWLYTGSDIPSQLECLKIHINLWLYQGNPPADGQEAEMVVKSAQLPETLALSHLYLPLVSQAAPAIGLLE